MTFVKRPRVFGRQLAREMTREEIDRVSGAHGGSNSGTVADACQAGTLTGQVCNSQASDPIDNG